MAAFQEEFISISSCWMGFKAISWFHTSNKDQPFCFNFQKRQCADPKIGNRRHACIGCGTEGEPCNECLCLQSRLKLTPGVGAPVASGSDVVSIAKRATEGQPIALSFRTVGLEPCS